MEKRRLIEVIPDSVIRFLNEWEVRVLIVTSLILQIILITLGKRRKHICKVWVRITLWCAYLMADWIAIVALGIVSKNTLAECTKVENNVQELMCFWSQFFLLHLGGPDTITAYSLEDNELWLRHLVALVVQTAVAFYILLVALPGSSLLPRLSILIFIAGLIKYMERVYALSAANSENFRDSMLTKPDAGPNYAKFMEEFTLKKVEGFHVKVEIPVPAQHSDPKDSGEQISEAYDLFSTFKCLFADAILSFQDRDSSRHYFLEKPLSPTQAFDVVEIELGLVFDELYTKASVVYKLRGFVLRAVTFSFTLLALMAFLFLDEKSEYKKLDLIITYLLLWVAICLEIYAFLVVINSDWTYNWLSRRERKTQLSLINRWFHQRNKRKRWSKKMAQHNLLDLCVGDRDPVCLSIRKSLRTILRFIRLDNYLKTHWYKTFVDVSTELKDLIFGEIKRDHFTLENSNCLSRDWENEKEFHQKILLLHIATDICYTLDNDEHHFSSGITKMKQDADNSKHISDYMLYLLIACPFMLPIGFGMIRFRDTCAELEEFLEERNIKTSKVKACKKLLEVNTEVPPGKVKGDRSKSVLFDACRLAKSLLAKKEDKWEVISKEWVKMLADAATHCRGNHHARQLRKGGELLTHVWLLMAHLGITEQLQISQGHARAKLIVK